MDMLRPVQPVVPAKSRGERSMSINDHGEEVSAPEFDEVIYNRLLDKTRGVADKALNRLRELSDQLPAGTVEQVERLHDNPVKERRKAARVKDSSIPVAVQMVDIPGEGGTAIKDHCPTGMAILLPCPAGPGTILRLRMPPEFGGKEWMTVEVKYCRKTEEGWVAGCELLSEQAPI